MSAFDREKARDILQTLANDVADHGSVKFSGYLDALAECAVEDYRIKKIELLADQFEVHHTANDSGSRMARRVRAILLGGV